MKTHAQELVVIYHPESSKARQTLAFAHTLSLKVKEWSYVKHSITTTMWRTLLKQLNLEPKQLLDKSHPYYQEHIRGREFDDEGWLNILKRNTHLIKGPIVVTGNRALLCNQPNDIFGLMQEPVVPAS